MMKAKIVGAGGYGGVGIIELLLGHPDVEIDCLVDTADIGRPISALYPHLSGYCDLSLTAPDAETAQAAAGVVFFATPDGVGIMSRTKIRNLFVNSGHGHLGWTMAPGAGKALAELMVKGQADINMEDYSLGRFR